MTTTTQAPLADVAATGARPTADPVTDKPTQALAELAVERIEIMNAIAALPVSNSTKSRRARAANQ